MLDDFTVLATDLAPRIRRLSFQKVPGLTREEVESEITYALWRAWSTYTDEGGASFDTWWFKCWTSRKSNLIEEFFRKKRVLLREATSDAAYQEALDTVMAEVGSAYGVEVIPPCPIQDDDAIQVWSLLAKGFRFTEVQSIAGLGRVKVENIVAKFQTHPETLGLLGL